PDAALASVASALILVLSGQGEAGVNSSIAIAIPLAIAGLILTIIVRTLATGIVHLMDAAAKKGNIRQIEIWHVIAICMQGLRRSEEHTSELQSRFDLVCRLLLEKKKKKNMK